MKFFVVVAALVAAAHAKADADADALLYTGVYGAYRSPLVYNNLGYNYHYPYTTYGAYPYTTFTGYHTLGKREADAEPKADADADAAVLYNAAYTSPLVYNNYYNHFPYTTYGAYPYTTYTGYPYTTYTGYHHFGKRSAEAEAKPFVYSAGYPFATYAGVYAPHGVVATPFGAVHSSHAGVCLNYLGVQVSC